MLAEAIHSVADTGNEVLLLIGGGQSRRARTAEHPFGFGRERYFYAFVVAVMLFTVGRGLLALRRHPQDHHPRPARQPGGRLRRARRVGRARVLLAAHRDPRVERAAGRAQLAAFVHLTKIPELPVVLLEDSAALIGLLFAFLGVLLSQLTGHEQWDGVGSVGIGVLLACAAFIVGYETKSLLIGESASEEVSARIVVRGGERTRAVPPHPPADLAHRAGHRCWSPGKIGVAAELTAADLAAGIDAPRSGSARRCRSRRRSTWSRTSTVRTRKT